MSNGKNKEVKVISFLSGKGGAGKTSVAIGVSYLLNDAGFKVLLIDFDFATNGASYFYKHLYPRPNKIIGIYELINRHLFDFNKIEINVYPILIKIKNNLCFIPSRVNFSKKLLLRDSIVVREEALKSFLQSLIHLWENEFDFIIIDNQAGSNLTAKVSASLSDKVIIVSELDPISSDSVDTLLIQIGESLPEYRRHLINKLDIRESEDYKKLSELFQTMNRLPPLPFDFEIRSAFSSRQIPIDVNKPSTFLIALYNTVKAFLPEYRNQIEQYGEKILSKFNQFQDKVNSLLDRKKQFEKEIDILSNKIEKRKLRSRMVISIIGLYIGVGITILGMQGRALFEALLPELFIITMGSLIVIASSYNFIISRMKYRERTEDIIKREKIDNEISAINKEIDRYKSLMLTRTKEFLLHFEAKKGNYHDSVKNT